LTDSLRHTGYDNYYAIADVIDNSIDANATHVWIEIHSKKNDFQIIVADDGIGMDKATLTEALKLGSETERIIETDLGRFGMGLCTAGLSMSRRTTVLTKQRGEDLLIGINDVDWIREHGFKSYIEKANTEDKQLFNRVIPSSSQGTIVIFSRSDKVQNQNTTVFANTLKKETGQIFRRFIEAGRKIYINGELVPLVDPLMLSDPNTYVYSDENYPIKITTPEGAIEDTVRIRLVLLPNFGAQGNKDRGINWQNQGFYLMRNERELFSGESLGMFTKHPDYNRIRGEICFSGSLDNLMGVHFTKRSLTTTQGLKDKLRELTRSQITHLRRMAKDQRPKEEKEVSHSESERLISKKSKLLIKPTPEEIDRKDKKLKVEKGKKETEQPRKEEPHERLRKICVFEEAKMDRAGVLYYAYMSGSKVVIRWNVDHPFYEKYLIAKQGDKTFITAIDFLVYSLASSELKARNDENVSLLENIRGNMSTNLRVLLD